MTGNGPISESREPEISQQQVLNGDSDSLRTLCAELHTKIEAFLQEDIKEERLKAVQAQCRHSLGIIQAALDRYPYVPQISRIPRFQDFPKTMFTP